MKLEDYKNNNIKMIWLNNYVIHLINHKMELIIIKIIYFIVLKIKIVKKLSK